MACVASVFLLVPHLHAQTVDVSDVQVKAALLYKIALFVKWPGSAFENRKAPLYIGVLGHDPFGRALDSVATRELNGHPIAIVRADNMEKLTHCHLVFLNLPSKTSEDENLSKLHAAGIVTVSDAQDFVNRGGMVELFLEENRVRIAINLDAAKRARVKFSSKLLGIVRVHRETP